MAGPKLQLFVETTKRLIRRQATANLKRIVGKTHPADIAHLFDHFIEREQRVIFDLIDDSEKAAEVLSEIDKASGVQLLEGMERARITEILQAMSSDDRADFISELPEELAEEILNLMAKKHSDQVEDLLSYQEDTAGRIMTPDFFALTGETSAKEAIEAIQKASEAEMVFYVFVVDDRGHLVGVISLRQLITVPPTKKLKEIMVTDVISVRTDMDQEEVARVVEKYNILAVPVVDEENKLVGIITVDDIIDVIREEETEDIMRMAGTHEDEFVYRDNVFKVSRFRLPWILTNLLGGLITGYLLWLFRMTIRDVLALVTFIPVITAMGGNVGVQSASIMVRGFATGRVDFDSLKRFLFREVRVGVIMGATCGFAVGLVGYFWHGNPTIGLVVGTAMVVAMTIASTMGTLTPAFFKKIKVDPAIASGPFVTTANDITGILVYFGVATLFLKYLIR
ncbi:MAG: magnesium transporter [Syntrophobacterales bacterium]|nr:MAG: magnesium transporter [Syntrophobacterales bacterium]